MKRFEDQRSDRRSRQRTPLFALRKMKSWWHHADDRIGLTIQLELSAHHLRIRRKPRTPKLIRQNHFVAQGRMLFITKKIAAQHGLHAQGSEEVVRNAKRRELLGLPKADHRQIVEVRERDILAGLALIAPLMKDAAIYREIAGNLEL